MTSQAEIKFKCGICEKVVELTDPDGYSLQVRKFKVNSPEMVWAHGVCLRRVIPVIGVEIPGSISEDEKNGTRFSRD